MKQELAQEIQNTAQDVVNQIHTAMTGKIMSFNASKGRATVRPYGKYITEEDGEMDYPDLTDVPVVFPYSMSAEVGITFPIKKGDDCLVIISETDLDEWLDGAAVDGSLRYDLNNAICIPGAMKKGGGAIEKAQKNNAVVISFGGATAMFSGSGMEIEGDLKVKDSIKCNSLNVGGSASCNGMTVNGNLTVNGTIINNGGVVLPG